ncbi:MAG TPA: valine--tRNA ligase [Chloroflexota bacterium]
MEAPRAAAMDELPKAYNPHDVEQKLYDFWVQRGYFTPKIDWSKKPFTIIQPPPNVTGELHLGHALTTTLEDILVRWRRMQGFPTLWLPGRDHAGIAGQLVVERAIAQEGLTRHDLGRERFLDRVWEWMNRYGRIIGEQHRKLGASLDWSRERFTMDPGPSRAVRTAFVRLYEKGLIYRGKRITNWCPRCHTALSDLEVEHQELQGILAFVRYRLVPRPGAPETEPQHLTIATTRPETILADTAVAVNPTDPRYQGLVGRQVLVPLVDRPVPVVADAAVDPEFGTGALKITPGHDPVDFEVGQRHNLPTISVITDQGTMSEEAGGYAGLSVAEARKRVLEDLRSRGLLERVEPYTHAVGHCQRCKTAVEPLITEQWYVRIKPLAEPAIEAVRDGRIRIIPERFTKVYFNWMENIRDWCISRQLWWGHRIPVWYCQQCGREIATVDEPTRCPGCHSADLVQDPDVLDTWFSSGLWPFSTLGWPDDTEDLRYFYPTSVMETGYDILFFWVARMIMLGLEFMGDVPFRDVYLHGLIRVGREKMSKTKGNVLDPLELIAKYGTDALRVTLTSGTTPGNDTQISDAKLEASRNFVNKLWNVGRFVLLNLSPDLRPTVERPLRAPDGATVADRWIVSRTSEVIAQVTRLLEDYQLGEAVRTIYEFLWGEYADWYVEIAKVQLREGDEAAQRRTQEVLGTVLERTLRLLHPVAPFVTEELWQRLRQPAEGQPESIMIAPWPEPSRDALDPAATDDMEAIIDVIRSIRNVRAEYRVDPARRIPATIVAEKRVDLFTAQASIVAALARLDPLTVVPTLPSRPAQALTVVAGGVEVYLPLAGMFDVKQERERLQKELEEARQDVARAEALLARPGFVQRAPAEVVDRERERLAAARERVVRLEQRIASLDA